jgi:hypothetical protein
MTIKDAENEWNLQQSTNTNGNSSNNQSILPRRNSLHMSNQQADVSNEAVEFIDLNTIKSAKDLQKYNNANMSNQTIDSGFVSVGNNSDYDVSNMNGRSANAKMQLKSSDRLPGSAKVLPRNVTSPSGSSLDNEDSSPQCANSKSNSRSNSTISNYSKSAITTNGNTHSRTNVNMNSSNSPNNGTVNAIPPANPNQTSTQTSNTNNSNNNNNNNNSTSNKKSIPLNNGSNVFEDNNALYFYGTKSLDIVDMKLDSTVINQITTLSFHYIDYDDYLSKCFYRIRNKFINATVWLFSLFFYHHLSLS